MTTSQDPTTDPSTAARCGRCLLGNHSGTNRTAGCSGHGCGCPCSEGGDPTMRVAIHLTYLVAHLTKRGYLNVPDTEVGDHLPEADDLAGIDLYAHRDGDLVWWDAEGTIGHQTPDGDFHVLDVDDLANLTTAEVSAWITDPEA